MATLASLVVSLEANVARFESDLNKAEFMAKKAMDSIGNVSDTAMKAVKGAVMAMAAAYTFDAFADGIKGAIVSAAELDHMAKKTGATVEALSGLKSAAKLWANSGSFDGAGGTTYSYNPVSVGFNYDGYALAADEIGGSEYRRNYRNCNCGAFNCRTNCNCACCGNCCGCC